jgi:predicted transcriptional regulator
MESSIEPVIERKTEVKGKFRNRSRLEIIASLLNIGKKGSLKTHLMYGGNLSYLMVTEYLSILTSSGLMIEERSEDGSFRQFRTTEKGLECLRLYESIRDMIGAPHLVGE